MALKVSHIDFVKNRKIYYIISCSLIAIAVIVSLIFGVKVDIQFRGGTIATYSYSGELNIDDFEKTVQDQTGMQVSARAAKNAATGEPNVTLNFASKEGLSAEAQTALTAALQEAYPDNNVETVSVNSVSPTMGKDFLLKCLVAVAFSAVFMILYIALRVRKIGGWSAGVFAVVALLHDIAMVFATFIIFRMSLDDNFIAVLLVILGYSINDTIVIYDRIRENERLHAGRLSEENVKDMVNLSINQTLPRTLNTTISTLIAMTVVCILAFANGVSSIVEFAFPLIIGLISGAYSSICLSGPLWVVWQQHKIRNKHNRKKSAKA